MNRTVKLSKKEVDIIHSMISIATAGREGEGDYQDFDYKALGMLARTLDQPDDKAEEHKLKAIKALLRRAETIQNNIVPEVTDGQLAMISAAEQALKLVLGQKNYVEQWISRAEASIKARHAATRPGCKCGVCK